MTRAALVGLILLVGACGARQRGSAGSPHVEATFGAAGVKRVELRAAEATAANVTEAPGDIAVSGTATGGLKTTQSGTPDVSAVEWGMSFRSQRHGDTLVISTEGEVSDAERRYILEDLTISVPPGVEVNLVSRALTGSRAPDLGRSGD